MPPVRGVVSGAVKDVVSISYVCLWDFLIHRNPFAKERVSMMALGVLEATAHDPCSIRGVNTFLKESLLPLSSNDRMAILSLLLSLRCNSALGDKR